MSVIATLALLYRAYFERTRAHHHALEQATERLQHSAMHDALTDLPNRLLLAQRLEQAIAHADEHGFALRNTADPILDHFKARQ